MPDYKNLMKLCIELAKKGGGKVSPNPMVGCVVLNNNGEIISEGYHERYGENHAERNALLKLKNGEEKDGTLVVNLEPCSHHGKTPPCTDLIIERRLKKVVIGSVDSNPKVSGIKQLKDAGIEVISGVLEKECRNLNEVFFCDMEQNRIFTALKTATTLDGKIATSNGDSKWITSEKSREKSKGLRQIYDAILTSSSTILTDNPKMEHKLKVILDKDFKTDFGFDIYKQGKIILVTTKNISDLPQNIQTIKPEIKDDRIDLEDLLIKLYELGIKSVFIEAGGELSGSFIKHGLVDKIYHFIAPKILNDNSGKSCFNGDNISKISESENFNLTDIEKIGNDAMMVYTKEKI